MQMVKADNLKHTSSGREEYNSIQEAVDALRSEREWEIDDG